MANLIVLKDKVKESGLKKSYIAERLGITRQSFSNKLNGVSDFKIEEMSNMCEVLDLSEEERDNIFLCK